MTTTTVPTPSATHSPTLKTLLVAAAFATAVTLAWLVAVAVRSDSPSAPARSATVPAASATTPTGSADALERRIAATAIMESLGSADALERRAAATDTPPAPMASADALERRNVTSSTAEAGRFGSVDAAERAAGR